MSYQRKRVNEAAQAGAARAPKRDATDMIWRRDLAHAFVFDRPDHERDEDATTIFERVEEIEASDILSDEEHALAIEGSLARSLVPRSRSWRRRALWGLSSAALLAAVAVWSSDGRHWASTSERTPTLRAVPLAHGEPLATPAPLPPAPIAAPETQPDVAAVGGTLEDTAAETDISIGKSERRGRHRVVSAHKSKAHAKTARSQHGVVARRIQPLPEPTESEDTEPTSDVAANQGTLQINSRPWSRIVVDGSFVGHTPQRALHLVAGKHHVQLVNDEMDMSKIIDLTISAGQTIKRIETLEENESPN